MRPIFVTKSKLRRNFCFVNVNYYPLLESWAIFVLINGYIVEKSVSIWHPKVSCENILTWDIFWSLLWSCLLILAVKSTWQAVLWLALWHPPWWLSYLWCAHITIALFVFFYSILATAVFPTLTSTYNNESQPCYNPSATKTTHWFDSCCCYQSHRALSSSGWEVVFSSLSA